MGLVIVFIFSTVCIFYICDKIKQTNKLYAFTGKILFLVGYSSRVSVAETGKSNDFTADIEKKAFAVSQGLNSQFSNQNEATVPTKASQNLRTKPESTTAAVNIPQQRAANKQDAIAAVPPPGVVLASPPPSTVPPVRPQGAVPPVRLQGAVPPVRLQGAVPPVRPQGAGTHFRSPGAGPPVRPPSTVPISPPSSAVSASPPPSAVPPIRPPCPVLAVPPPGVVLPVRSPGKQTVRTDNSKMKM